MTWVSFIFPAPPWLDQDVRASKRTSSSQISSMETPGESAGKPRFCEAPRPSLCQPHYVRLTLSIPRPLYKLALGFHSTRASFPTADLPQQCCDGENHTSEGALLHPVSPPASLFASTGSFLSVCCSIHSIQAPGGQRGAG